MHFDDRLATVLRHRAAGERAAKTQFRQLIDLLGERPQAGDRALKAASYLRLIALAEMISVQDRANIVSESGWRFRNPELVRWFGQAHPTVAAAALYRAQLTGPEWEDLIPRLPIRARGFLRHRRDLPEAAVRVLDHLGVQDRALPLPDLPIEMPKPQERPADLEEEFDAPAPFVLKTAAIDATEVPEEIEETAETKEVEDAELPQEAPEPSLAPTENGKGEEIRALVQRIEAFKRNRSVPDRHGDAPTLPLAELAEPAARKRIDSFDFGTDSEGRIDWAEADIAPMVIGTDLATRREGDVVGEDFASAFFNRQPVHAAPLSLRGAEAIEGDWVVDASPRFTRSEGRFYGYVGRFRRAVAAGDDRAERGADRLRQLLHELRTPVNAMQGYAEVIQQQVFGPTPHEYRALAASIAGDSARILAGFDELDRLAKLETGALDLEPGESDFAAIARAQVGQLQSVLGPRVARFQANIANTPAPLPLAENEAEMLAWRVLATLAGATGAGETVSLDLRTEKDQVALRTQLPAQLARTEDIFASEARSAGNTLSSGIFGAGFSLRLARAEARAAGGELARDGSWLVLSLPLLTAGERDHSPADAPDRASG